MAFHCTVVTPEQQAFDAQIKQAILPAHDGLIGVLTDRAPLLVKLGAGPLRIDQGDNQSRFYFISGGVAQMKDNKLTILTEEATPAEQIDYEAARAEFEAARAQPAADAKAAAEREKAMERARAKEAIARR